MRDVIAPKSPLHRLLPLRDKVPEGRMRGEPHAHHPEGIL